MSARRQIALIECDCCNGMRRKTSKVLVAPGSTAQKCDCAMCGHPCSSHEPLEVRQTRAVCSECRSYVPLGWLHSCDGEIAKTWERADPSNYTQRSVRK